MVRVIDTPLKIFNLETHIHPISEANNELFSSLNELNDHDLNGIERVADIGSGCAIFSLIFALVLSKRKLRLNRLTLADVVKDAGKVGIINFNLNRKYIRVNEIEFIQSDLLNNLNSRFDIVLVNLPQAPTLVMTKVDRCGKEDGSYFNCAFANDVKRIIHSESIILQLHVSTSNPNKLYQTYKDNGMKVSFYREQMRTTNKVELDTIHDSVYDQMVLLNSKGIAECEIN